VCFQAKICNLDLPNRRRNTDYWKVTLHTHTHIHTHIYIYIIKHLILYARYRPPFLGMYKVINRYYWKMGIFKCSYSGGSSVSTVTRLPEAHTLLFAVACRPALGRTEPDIQHILAATLPWGQSGQCQVYHSPPPSAETKNSWSYNSIPHISLGLDV
jgi:hypothetical protein